MQDLNRRQFIQKASMATAALALPTWSIAGVETKMGIVVHSYAFRWNSKTPSKKYPAFTNAIELLEHTYEIGGAGVQVVVNGWDSDFAKKVRERREKLGLYLEGSIGMPNKQEDLPAFEQTVVKAKEAGATILRTVTSTGRRYEAYHTAAEVEDFKKKAVQQIQWVEPILKKHKVKLAVENHKDWTAPELAATMKKFSSEHVGVTLDFGNSIALMEQPMSVIETLVPYVVSTHVKDMAVDEYENGFLLSEVPLGKGILDLDKIFALCVKNNKNVKFSLEMITRDPLQIPVNTDEYKAVVPSSGFDIEGLGKLSEKQSMAPSTVSQLDEEGKLAVEEQNILECIKYSKSKLGK
jgi:sugar phosphate isomerase/epimerase